MCAKDTDVPTFQPLSLPHVLSELCDKQNSWTDGRTRINLPHPKLPFFVNGGIKFCNFVIFLEGNTLV